MLNSDQGREGLYLKLSMMTLVHMQISVCLWGLFISSRNNTNRQLEFAKATNEKPDAIEGSNSYLSCYYAGQCREKQHRMDEAKEFYRKAGNYEPAKERLERIG